MNFGLELLDVVLVAGLLQGVIALVHHVRVIDARRANHSHLVQPLLLFKHFIGALAIA